MALLTCENVTFGYDGRPAVSGLNFSIQSGDYLCIVGENGAGKSTLIKGLLRLKTPQQGKITLGDGLKANEIGYLPQQTAAQKDFPASVYEVVLSGRLSLRGLRPFYTKQDHEAARENLRTVQMDNLADRCYRELSGGQQQRVLLARALCATRKMLLLDEPVAGLDPVVTAELYRAIADINKQQCITVLMVSHDIQSAVQYASHILHLKHQQVFFGRTADYAQSDVGKAFMGGVAHV